MSLNAGTSNSMTPTTTTNDTAPLLSGARQPFVPSQRNNNPAASTATSSISSHVIGNKSSNPYHRSVNWTSPPPAVPMTVGGPNVGEEYEKYHDQNAQQHPSQQLEYKLHVTAASFRQSRDTAHRNCKLAQERLRIVQQEYHAAKVSIQSLQQHLESLQQKYHTDQQAHQEMQKDVQQSSNEVRFA
jgi:hypothetical protein